MALAKFKTSENANKGIPVDIYSPDTNLPTGTRFFMLGLDSEEAKKIIRKQDKVRLEKQKRARGVYLQNADETEANLIEILTDLTTGWETDVLDDNGTVTSIRHEIELEEGEFVPFSKEAAKALYSDRGYSFIREQIDAAINDRRNFLPGASRS